MKKTILTLIAILLALLVVVSVGYGQDSAEPEYVPAVPVEIEYIDGDVVISQIGERLFAVTDKGLHTKIDALVKRVASLEATLLSQADTAPPPKPTININIASYDELLTVPGIGPVKAGSIIADRGQSGEYSSWADLMRRVAGVGPATIADMQAGGATLE